MGLAYLLEPSFQIVDKSGNPLSNGYIEVYISGTSTKYYCYSDFNGSLHPFRIPLDAIGSNIILASSELIYDVFIYNSFGTLVMSRHRVEPISSTTTSGYAYIFIEGTEGQIAVQATGSTDITYKVGLSDAIINELSGIHNDISSTSAYLDNKINTEISNRTTADQYIQEQINNLDIHNISIEQSGDGNAYTSFTKNGDVYTFNKEATYLPSANAPVVLAGENVEVSSANINGKMQYTIKANPAGNVTNLISTDETISISATSAGNNVTYDLSVKDIAGDDVAKNYAFLKSEMPVNTSLMGLEFTNISTNGIHWNTIDQRLEFGENIKLVDLNYNIAYEIDSANGVTYEDLILYIYSDGQLLEQETFTIDTSIAKHICKLNKKILDPSNLQFSVKAPKNGAVDVTIDINDETFKSTAGGGSTYYAGEGIAITNSEISVNAGKGLGFDVDNKLEVKVGEGLDYDSENKVITIDSDVSAVVANVNKLKQDLDTKLTVNFDMAGITHTFDFADSNTTKLTNGATMLCQAFTVPINNEIRLASKDKDPTLIGIYAKQSYSNKIMLALYVYDFYTGDTEYVADTGPVKVAAGRNEFPIKHINPGIVELKSNCVYYAALYLPSSHSTGLYLASCQSYSNASYINAAPRFTVGVQNITHNGSEISLESDTTGRLDYNDGKGNYYIGPWSDGYNEIPDAPRFFMQLRNGKVAEPFVNISSYTISIQAINSLFTDASELGSPSYPVVYRAVTPKSNITIDWWQSWSPLSTDEHKLGAIIYSSGFNNKICDKANVTVTDLEQSDGLYARKYTPASSITLTAGVTYRFPVWLGNANYTDNCITYDTPSTSTVLHLFQSAWSINEWASYKRLNDVAAMPLILHDTDGNTYRI